MLYQSCLKINPGNAGIFSSINLPGTWTKVVRILQPAWKTRDNVPCFTMVNFPGKMRTIFHGQKSSEYSRYMENQGQFSMQAGTFSRDNFPCRLVHFPHFTMDNFPFFLNAFNGQAGIGWTKVVRILQPHISMDFQGKTWTFFTRVVAL